MVYFPSFKNQIQIKFFYSFFCIELNFPLTNSFHQTICQVLSILIYLHNAIFTGLQYLTDE